MRYKGGPFLAYNSTLIPFSSAYLRNCRFVDLIWDNYFLLLYSSSVLLFNILKRARGDRMVRHTADSSVIIYSRSQPSLIVSAHDKRNHSSCCGMMKLISVPKS